MTIGKDRVIRVDSGKPPGKAFQAIFAFLTRAGIHRPGQFDGDFSFGPVAENDAGKGGRKDESQIDESRGKAEKPSPGLIPQLHFHKPVYSIVIR